jgi:hypothetical protein
VSVRPASRNPAPCTPTKKKTPTKQGGTTVCEATETLTRARYELDLMLGNGVIDIGRLKQILGTTCERHE